MLLFIEGYPYKLDYEIREGLTIEDALGGVVSFLNKKEKYYRPEYVGYCYSKSADIRDDSVSFLSFLKTILRVRLILVKLPDSPTSPIQ